MTKNPKFKIPNLKSFAKENYALFITLGLVLIPFFFVWLRGRLFYDFDMTFITAPIEDMFAHFERAGQLPLWAPQLQMGYPLIAISHLGFFYPLHFVLREFLPGVITLNISLFFHAVLATIGMYLLLKQEKFQKQSSAFGAFIFAGTGFFVGRYYLTNVILPLAWTPLCLWLLGNWLKNKSYKSLLGLSVAIAMQVLLGQPQAAMISAFALALYALAHFIIAPKIIASRLIYLVPAAILTILLAYMQIGPTLDIVPFSDRSDAMLPQELYEFNLPFYHLSSWIFPHAFGYHENYIGAKNETELSSWLGITTITIIFVGILSFRRMPRRPLIFVILLFALSFLMITGESSPLYRYLVENHWLDSLGIPARWILLLIIAFSFVGAFGAEALVAIGKKKRTIILFISIVIILAITYLSLLSVPANIRPQVKTNLLQNYFRTIIPFLAIPFIFYLGRKISEKQIYFLVVLAALEVLLPNLTRNVSVPFKQPFIITKSETFLKNQPTLETRLFSQRDLALDREPQQALHQYKRVDRDVTIKQSFESAGSELRGVVLDLRWSKGQEKIIKMTLQIRDENTQQNQDIVFLTATANKEKPLEIIFPIAFKNANKHVFSVSLFQQETKIGPWITYVGYPNGGNFDYLRGGYASFCLLNQCETPRFKDAKEPDVALTPIYEDFNRIKLSQEILSPHIGASKDIPSTQWLGALQLKEVKRYLYEIGDQNENADGYNPLLKLRRELLNRLGANYLLGSYGNNRDLGDLGGVKLIQETQDEGQTIRLYQNLEATPRVEFAKNAQSVNHPDGARAVLFDAKTSSDPVPVEDDTLLKDKQISVGSAKITSYQSTTVTIETENKGEGLLILRDTYYPDWHAFIDNKETRIFPTDWIFRGVIVPAGNHTVTFKYLPDKTLRAVKTSVISWLLLLLILLTYSTWHFLLNRKNNEV